MIGQLTVFELKNLTQQKWHFIISGSFIFFSLFFASLNTFKSTQAIFFILFLSAFLAEAQVSQEDIDDGTLLLIYNSPLSLEIYHVVKLTTGWVLRYLTHIAFVLLGSLFFEEPLAAVVQALCFWAPVSLALTALLQALKLLARHSSVQYILAVPLIFPLLLFYQEALQSGHWSFEAQILCGLCLGLTVVSLLTSVFVTKTC